MHKQGYSEQDSYDQYCVDQASHALDKAETRGVKHVGFDLPAIRSSTHPRVLFALQPVLIPKDSGLPALYDLEHWQNLQTQVDDHPECKHQLDELAEDSVVQVHQHHLLQSVTVGQHADDTHERLE